jgi:hypothetical protein
MNSSFGVFDAFAFVVCAVLIVAVVVVIVGKLPGQLARKWGHPQAAAVNVGSWIGLATRGLLWPLRLALIGRAGKSTELVVDEPLRNDLAPPQELERVDRCRR